MADNRVNIKENEKMDKYLDLDSKQKKVQDEGDGDTNCHLCTSNSLQRLAKDAGEKDAAESGNQRKNRKQKTVTLGL